MSVPTKLKVEGLKCYRNILLLHRKLPEEFQNLGNNYVKEEFKKHHYPTIPNFSAAHYTTFLSQWQTYLELMSQPETQLYGRNLQPEELQKMSKQQRETINEYQTNFIYNK